MAAWLLILMCALFGALVFAIASLGDAPRFAALIERHRHTLFALSLAVYCTSWTFFGAVGAAATQGWAYLPIYLGPALVFLAAPGIVRRVMTLSQRHNIATLSDFLAARYGRCRSLAALATTLAATGALPYIALQLQSIGQSFDALHANDFATPGDAVFAPSVTTVLIAALTLAAFSMMFGVRSADTSTRNRGLVVVLAVEAVVKLLALIAVAVFAVVLLQRVGEPTPHATTAFAAPTPALHFVTVTLLAMAAVLCLPRQFHVTVAEAPSEVDAAVARARWVFPAYLGLTSVVVIPITLAGQRVLGSAAAPDLYVLALPALLGGESLAVFVFLGGLAAATGMIIVTTIALSTMVTHDLVIPAIMRWGSRSAQRPRLGLVALRRSVVGALMTLAFGYWWLAGGSSALAQTGLIAFVAAAQLAPALIGGLFWRSGHRNGALAGVGVGAALWLYTLVLPALIGGPDPWLTGNWAPFSAPFNPHGLFGLTGLDPVTHGALVSLAANITAYVWVSLKAAPRLIDRVQAGAFMHADAGPTPAQARREHASHEVAVSVGDLQLLASRFLEPGAVARAFQAMARDHDQAFAADDKADWRIVQQTERLIAGAVGTSTARIVLESALSDADVSFSDVLSLLDETHDDRRFKRHLLQATLENLNLGVSVVDKHLRIVAWNGIYLDLFGYPRGFVHVGRPIEELIRHNAERGELGPGDVDVQIQRRLAFLREGGPHQFERTNADGRVLRLVGRPMPGGGYVTTFEDVTDQRHVESALREAKATLEHRVAERTADLLAASEERDRARQRAERSEATKTRFLAAASHDLQQPLNAARLFSAALAERFDADSPEARMAHNVDKAIQSADGMLRGLLDLSKFDHDGVTVGKETIVLADLWNEVEHSHAPQAREQNLRLRFVGGRQADLADRALVASIVHNLVSNALRYTQTGGVLLGARPRNDNTSIEIQVWDTGPGIPEAARSRIFEEFSRLHETDQRGERGSGLGLAIVARAADLMGAQITVSSRPGRGSVFGVALPAANARFETAPQDQRPSQQPMAGMRVLCLDDDASVLSGMAALLTAWGCAPVCVSEPGSALALLEGGDAIEAVLADYDLGPGVMTGADVLQAATRLRPLVRGALISADHSPSLQIEARRCGCALFTKPVDPQALRTFLNRSKSLAAE